MTFDIGYVICVYFLVCQRDIMKYVFSVLNSRREEWTRADFHVFLSASFKYFFKYLEISPRPPLCVLAACVKSPKNAALTNVATRRGLM